MMITVQKQCSVGPSYECCHNDNPEMEVNQSDNSSDDKQHEYPMKLQNSDVLANLDEKVAIFQKSCRVN